MKKPKVFVNNIDKNIKNNKEAYHFKKEDDRSVPIVEDINIREKLNDIFNGTDFVYKSKLDITLKNGKRMIEDVIALKDNCLLTLDDLKINIDEIANIKKAN